MSTSNALTEAQRLAESTLEGIGQEARSIIINPNYFRDVSSPNRIAQALALKSRKTLSSLMQINTILEDTEKCRIMVRRFPWGRSSIKRSDHFYFVWLNFTTQCYLFRERTKIFLNTHNRLAVALATSQFDVKCILKRVDKAFSQEIRYRGQHTHEQHINDPTYDDYKLFEFMETIDQDGIYPTEYSYKKTKRDIEESIKKKLSIMFSFYREFSSDADLTLQSAAKVLLVVIAQDGK